LKATVLLKGTVHLFIIQTKWASIPKIAVSLEIKRATNKKTHGTVN